jgi:DNA polymerase-1
MLKLSTPVTPGTRMLLTVHDELVFECPTQEVEDAKSRIRAAMQDVLTLSVPLVVDVGAGRDWREAH